MKHKANVAHCKLILQHLPSAMQLHQTKNTFPKKKISQTTRSTRKCLVLFRGVLKLMVKKKKGKTIYSDYTAEKLGVSGALHTWKLCQQFRGDKEMEDEANNCWRRNQCLLLLCTIRRQGEGSRHRGITNMATLSMNWLWSDNLPLPCPVFIIQVIPRQSVVVVVSQAVFLSI